MPSGPGAGEPPGWARELEENKTMRIAGVILLLIGGLVFLIGMVICFATLTSDYASSTCEKAARDEIAIREARAKCGSPATECYRQATIGLATQEECESRQSFMRRQLVMGIIPSVIGGLLAAVGLLLTIVGFVRARRRKAAA